MARINLSSKRLQIDKASRRVTLSVAIAAFVLIFSLVSSKALLEKRAYQSRIVSKKETAVRVLAQNLEAIGPLQNSYREFVEQEANIINGRRVGDTDRDGDNAKITLDALPSKYDFPALATSIEKLITQTNITIESIEGSDQELEQSDVDAAVPEPYEMPFSISVKSTYDPLYQLVNIFELSIRPIQLQSVKFTVDTQDVVQLNIDALTYYLPEKSLNIREESVE
jgi:Tfp pilus assembly protein PilO